jgi:hypothetical protein
LKRERAEERAEKVEREMREMREAEKRKREEGSADDVSSDPFGVALPPNQTVSERQIWLTEC